MDESVSRTTTHLRDLHEMSAEQLLDYKREILEADKPFPLPCAEECEVQFIKDEIISRVVEPIHAAIPTGPHTDAQILIGAIAVIATVVLGFIPALWWLHALLATSICCWLALHWQYLFPRKAKV